MRCPPYLAAYGACGDSSGNRNLAPTAPAKEGKLGIAKLLSWALALVAWAKVAQAALTAASYT